MHGQRNTKTKHAVACSSVICVLKCWVIVNRFENIQSTSLLYLFDGYIVGVKYLDFI